MMAESNIYCMTSGSMVGTCMTVLYQFERRRNLIAYNVSNYKTYYSVRFVKKLMHRVVIIKQFKK